MEGSFKDEKGILIVLSGWLRVDHPNFKVFGVRVFDSGNCVVEKPANTVSSVEVARGKVVTHG